MAVAGSLSLTVDGQTGAFFDPGRTGAFFHPWTDGSFLSPWTDGSFLPWAPVWTLGARMHAGERRVPSPLASPLSLLHVCTIVSRYPSRSLNSNHVHQGAGGDCSGQYPPVEASCLVRDTVLNSPSRSIIKHRSTCTATQTARPASITLPDQRHQINRGPADSTIKSVFLLPDPAGAMSAFCMS